MERAALLFDDAEVNGKPKRAMSPLQNSRATENAVMADLTVSVERIEALVLQLSDRLKEMEKALTSLIAKDSQRECYLTREVAGMLHRDEYTVREWARLGRINANKLKADVATRESGGCRTRRLFEFRTRGYSPTCG